MAHTTSPVAAPQALRALQLANQVRRARTEIKSQVAGGQLGVAEIILTCPAGIMSMPVAHLLASQRGWGEVRSRAFLARVAIRGEKSIGSLTERQRRTIAALLTERLARASLKKTGAVAAK